MIKKILSFFSNASVVYACIVTLVMIFAVKGCLSFKAEKEIYENNQNALLTEVETYKTESGKNAAKSRELQLTLDEFKKNYQEQVDVIKDLDLKVKRLQSINTTLTQTIAGGSADIHNNTVIVHDTVVKDGDTIFIDKPVTVRTFEWSDAWNKIHGTIGEKKVDCFYEGTDSLNIVVVRVPKKFLFFKWGTKYLEAHATNANPSTKINYTRTITIRKK